MRGTESENVQMCVAHYVEISMPSDITEFDTFIHDIKLRIDFVIIFFRFFRIK